MAEAEYWRGFGFGIALAAQPDLVGRIQAQISAGSIEVRLAGWLIEGLGMARCYISSEQSFVLLQSSRSESLDPTQYFGYGLGRASFYCGLTDEDRAGLGTGADDALEHGLRDAWNHDYAAAGASDFESRPRHFKVY